MRSVPGFDGYYADEYGVIYSDRAGALVELKTREQRGYRCVTVKQDGRARAPVSVAHLVLLAFEGAPPSPHHVCRMKDGNTLNAERGNLEWATRRDVVAGMVERGTASCLRRGEESNRATLSDAQVGSIRERVSSGQSQTATAREFGVSQKHVSDLVRGRLRVADPLGGVNL